MKIVNILFALLILVSATFAPTSASARPLNGASPVNVTLNPANPQQGDTVLVTITFDRITDCNETVGITAMGSIWSQCPQTVTLLNGYDTVSFYATIGTSAYGTGRIVASCNGESAGSGACFIGLQP